MLDAAVVDIFVSELGNLFFSSSAVAFRSASRVLLRAATNVDDCATHAVPFAIAASREQADEAGLSSACGNQLVLKSKRAMTSIASRREQ